MAELREDNEPYDEINVVPMLDLAYVLLVIFIIMTTATVQGIMVNLPKASATAAVPDLPVVIKGDEGLPYGKVIEVMDLCGRLDITQLGLVTAKIVK